MPSKDKLKDWSVITGLMNPVDMTAKEKEEPNLKTEDVLALMEEANENLAAIFARMEERRESEQYGDPDREVRESQC